MTYVLQFVLWMFELKQDISYSKKKDFILDNDWITILEMIISDVQ